MLLAKTYDSLYHSLTSGKNLEELADFIDSKVKPTSTPTYAH